MTDLRSTFSSPPAAAPASGAATRRSAWRWTAVAVLVVPALLGLGTMLWPTSAAEPTGPLRGVRLGYAPSQARRDLVTGGSGSFSTLAMGEDFALVWSPDTPSELRAARMEFHLGQLVALRLTLAPDVPEAQGPPLAISEASILSRETTPDGVELTWLARGCPTHADEVRRRMADSR